MERRSLLDDEMEPTRDNTDVFSDEFEVEDFDLVADGFRPGSNHDREGGSPQDYEQEPVRTVSPRYASGPSTSARPSRNSTRKSRSQPNPFASPEDNSAEPPLERTPSGNFAPSTAHDRSVSSASSAQYAESSSPRFGAAGPSHPYGMYAQGTVARTPSTATNSTARPGRRSMSRNGPQHPYALYPQGIGDEMDDEDEAPQNPVPVGFLGLGRSYERRRGPDGEEHGMVGDYGHTEQLPPYTRYPEDAPEKMPLMGVPNPPPALHSHAPVLGTDPGMSLMHDNIQPAQQSMTDASNLQRQPSIMSRMSGPPAEIVNSRPDSLASRKTWKEKSWKEKKKTRFCGIPFWYFLLGAGGCCFVVIMIGAVVGGYVEGTKKAQHHAMKLASSSLYDASFIATPTGTSPPTGTFALPLGMPQQTQSGCLTRPGQREAWTCGLAGTADLTITIVNSTGNNQAGAFLSASVGAATGDVPQLYYGTQMSNMQTQFSPFLLVKDNEAPQNGQAFYFEQQYDKLVVIPENYLHSAGSSRTKREAAPVPPFGNIAEPGAKPWFCFWNETTVEGFIYTHVPAAASLTSSSSSTMPTASSSTTAGTAASAPTPLTSMPARWEPTAIVSTTLTMPSTTCTYSGVASGYLPWLQSNYPNYDDDGDSSKVGKRQVNVNGAEDENFPVYPYLIKLEERRLPGSPQAYCQQAQVLDNGLWNWLTHADGNIFTVQLNESDPGYGAYQAEGLAGSRRLRLRQEVPQGCHCQWMSGQ